MDLRSIFPFCSLEVVRNGEVVARGRPAMAHGGPQADYLAWLERPFVDALRALEARCATRARETAKWS